MCTAWSVSTRFPTFRAASMSDTSLHATTQFRVANASIFMGTIAGIVVLIGLLLSFDLFLAHLDQRESATRAASEYQSGVSALRAGRPSDAADHFGAAVGIERSNVNYALALGEAMLQEGRTADAEATLRTLLERAENDGAVNLTMAHVMVREARTEDAKAYLHRAIFGRWGADSIERRNQARFELIDLLAKRGTPRELLAELLPLEEVSPDSVALRLRLGKLVHSRRVARARGNDVSRSAQARSDGQRSVRRPRRNSDRGWQPANGPRGFGRSGAVASRTTRKRCAGSSWWTRCSPSTQQRGVSRRASDYRGVARCSRGRSLWCLRAPVAASGGAGLGESTAFTAADTASVPAARRFRGRG